MGVESQAFQDCFIIGARSSENILISIKKQCEMFSNVTHKNKIIYSLSQAKLLTLLNSVQPRVDLNVSAGLQDSFPAKLTAVRSESIFKCFTFLLSIWQHRMFPVPTKKKKNVKEVQVGNQQSGNTNTFLIENYSFPHKGDKTSVVIKVTLQFFFPPCYVSY